MAKRCQGLNSKCFLITYLMIVSFLLLLWFNRQSFTEQDARVIPVDMKDYIESPPRPLPVFSLSSADKQVLTNDWLHNKWSFVYFSHQHCWPECHTALQKIKGLHASFANNDLQFLIIDIDDENETAETLANFLSSQQLDFVQVGSADVRQINALAKSFVALFLRSDYADGSYKIEQEHHIFVVDPKGRVYATFRPPYTDLSIQSQFIKLRRFYAGTE